MDGVGIYFTIPPLLASIWMGRTWIGLRYILHYTTSTIPLYGWVEHE